MPNEPDSRGSRIVNLQIHPLRLLRTLRLFLPHRRTHLARRRRRVPFIVASLLPTSEGAIHSLSWSIAFRSIHSLSHSFFQQA